MSRSLAGILTSAGVIVRKLSYKRSVAGGISLSGTIDYVLGLIKRSVAGVITLAGSLSRKVNYQRPVAGTLTTQGVLSRSLTMFRNIIGTLSASGSVTRKAMYKRSASGGLNFSGIIDYVLGLITRAMAGAISFAGTVTRKVNYKRPGCGTLDSSGIIQRSAAYARNVAGGISWSGIVRAVTAGLGMIIDPIITSVTTARTFVSNTIKRIISGK